MQQPSGMPRHGRHRRRPVADLIAGTPLRRAVINPGRVSFGQLTQKGTIAVTSEALVFAARLAKLDLSKAKHD